MIQLNYLTKTLNYFLAICLLFLYSNSLTGQNSVTGTWGPVMTTDMIPVACANLPDGRILSWSAYARYHFGPDTENGSTYTSIFDPTNNSFATTLVANTGHDMFCPGITNMGNGEIVITGGSSSAKTTIYNPANNTFRVGGRMNTPRGYHASVTLTDGRAFTIGGSWSGGRFNKKAEVWTASTGWTTLQNVDSDLTVRQGAPDPDGIYRDDNHAWLWAAPNNRVFQAGPGTNMHWITTTGQGSVTDAGVRGNDTYAMNGNSVMYDRGKILTLGGAQSYNNGTPASNRSYIIDILGGDANVTQSGNMSRARTLQNSVVLPNGEVLTVGGMCTSLLFSDQCAHLIPEIWNPNTGTWRDLAAMQTPRTYHSVAILMQDGRVWVAGGGLCGDCPVNHNDAEIYTPPYLYQGDTLAARPIINTVPATANYNTSITVTTNTGVQEFVLMRLSSATHAINNEQRRIPLTFNNNGGNNYTVNIPNNDWLPPGNYFLFALNNGVPSVGQTINIGNNGAPPPPPANQLIANGNYYIESTPTGQHLASPAFDGNNVRMVAQATDADQQWEFTHLVFNIYNVKNLRTDRYLNAFQAGCANAVNVVTATDSLANDSKWIISQDGGDYFLNPLHCTDHALANGGGQNTSAQIAEYSTGNNNERFKIKATSGVVDPPPPPAGGAGERIIVNGTYLIQSKADGQNAISPAWDGFNVRQFAPAIVYPDHQWIFEHIGGGKHTIRNNGTNRYLEATAGRCANGTNITTGGAANAENLRWYVEVVNGEYMLIPAHCTSHAMDRNANGVNIILGTNNAADANLKWDLIPQNGSPELNGGTVDPPPTGGAGERIIVNGTYLMQSKADGQNTISPTWDGFNVRQFAPAIVYPDHQWIFEHIGDGKHTIRNNGTNRYLEAAAGRCANGTNITTGVAANAESLRWYVEIINNEYMLIPAHCTSHAMDRNANDVNIILGTNNAADANLKWDLIPQNGSVIPRENLIEKDLRATPILGRQTQLNWYVTQVESKKATQYTFQYYHEEYEDFEDIEVLAATDAIGLEAYDLVHQNPKLGNNYYQVKIDFEDGSVDYSNFKLVIFEPDAAEIAIAPNPARDELRIDLANYMDEPIHYFVSSMMGQVIVHGNYNENHSEIEAINLSDFPDGTYIIYLRPTQGREITKKFVVLKKR